MRNISLSLIALANCSMRRNNEFRVLRCVGSFTLLLFIKWAEMEDPVQASQQMAGNQR